MGTVSATISAVSTGGSTPFLRGDCNSDGNLDLSGPIAVLTFMFLGQEEPSCKDACDSNDDGVLDVSDPITSLAYMFFGQGPLPLPGVEVCGDDPTGDELGCEVFSGCPEET